MFWKAGGLYLVLLEAAACATFAWTRWWDPDLASGSGFWISGVGTIFLGLSMLAFETVAIFWSSDSAPVRRFLHILIGVGLGATAVYGLGPFGEAAFLRLATTGNL